jgi:glycosyltransferase involved in cell wall biosynthesis
MSDPTVTVVTPVWNHADFLPETVDSILNQTFEDFEYIIIAEPSPDNTVEVAKQQAERDHRIRLEVNDERLRTPKCYNKGLKMARGDFIAINDADDLSTPQRLETQLEYMREHPNTVLTLQHDYYARLIDGDGNIINQYFYPEDYHYPPESGIFPRTFTRVHSSHMYRNVKPRYREKFIHSQDVDMYVRCLGSDYDVKIMKDDLATRRVHENQKQSRSLDASADDLNAEYGLNEVALEDYFNYLRGWPLRYPRWNPDLPYEVEDYSPHEIHYI